MSVPGIVQSTLNGEEIAARVSLGGEDELFITSSSTIVYRSDGLLSDESIDEFSHDADRLTLSEGRRKTKFTLEYPLEGTREFTVPAGKTDAVLHPVLAGVLNGNAITDPGETVVKTYRFSELTLIITSDRLVKHIGAAVWDDDFEEYHFGDVTNLTFEDGSVATQIVLTANGRPQRIKAPNEEANDLRERLQRALFEYHDVGSLEELNLKVGDDEDADDGRDRASVDFGDSVDPLDANPPELDDQETDEPAGDASEPRRSQPTDPLADGTATAGADSEASASEAPRDGPQTNPSRDDPQTQPSQGRPHQSGQQTEPGPAPAADARTNTDSGTETEPESNHDTAATTSESDTAFEMTTDASAASDADPEHSATADIDAGPDRVDHESVTESASLLEPDAVDPTVDAGSDSNPDHVELVERVESLEAAVDRQTEVIERQQRTIEKLIDELRKSR